MAVAAKMAYAILDRSLLRIDRVAMASGLDRPVYSGSTKSTAPTSNHRRSGGRMIGSHRRSPVPDTTSAPPSCGAAALGRRTDDMTETETPTDAVGSGGEVAQINALADHDYLVRIHGPDDPIDVRIHATPAVVALIASAGNHEPWIVEATAAYLIARQPPDDLPTSLDLDDVAAAYDGYIEALREQLGTR
jgi:hypothetical protein